MYFNKVSGIFGITIRLGNYIGNLYGGNWTYCNLIFIASYSVNLFSILFFGLLSYL